MLRSLSVCILLLLLFEFYLFWFFESTIKTVCAVSTQYVAFFYTNILLPNTEYKDRHKNGLYSFNLPNIVWIYNRRNRQYTYTTIPSYIYDRFVHQRIERRRRRRR